MMETATYTKFEKARLLGARALQLSMGAPFLIKIEDAQLKSMAYNPIQIAKLELDKDVIPMTIIRPMPHTLRQTIDDRE